MSYGDFGTRERRRAQHMPDSGRPFGHSGDRQMMFLRNASARIGVALTTTVAAVVLSGCKPDPNLPTSEMKRAQDAIEHAEKAGAQRYAMADLQQAKAAYKQADDARHQGNVDASRVHAMEAATLAARAATLASNGESQRADAEVQRSTDVAKGAADATGTGSVDRAAVGPRDTGAADAAASDSNQTRQ